MHTHTILTTIDFNYEQSTNERTDEEEEEKINYRTILTFNIFFFFFNCYESQTMNFFFVSKKFINLFFFSSVKINGKEKFLFKIQMSNFSEAIKTDTRKKRPKCKKNKIDNKQHLTNVKFSLFISLYEMY